MAVSDARELIKGMLVRGIDRSTVRDGKSRIVNGDEMATHPDRCGMPEGHPVVTAFLGVPLKHGEETIGMIGLGNKEGGYTLADQQAVEHLAIAFVEALRSMRAEGRLDRMQTELAHVARVSTLGEMVAGIAHEVNQPLYSIRNYTQASANVLAGEGTTDLGNLRQWNDAINRSAVRASEIVKRLRGFVRRTDAERTFCEIDELLDEAVQIVAPEAGRQRVAVRLEPTETPSTVHVDRIEIQQVLVNLLQNAYEALADAETRRREVTVRMEPDGQFVEVTVADNGPGLPADEDSHIFDTFVTTKQNGMGMGLAIATTIVETHGGKLWGTSNPEGGATFHFTLPVAEEEEEVDGQ
jgi:two-component system sensor kinase FixL